MDPFKSSGTYGIAWRVKSLCSAYKRACLRQGSALDVVMKSTSIDADVQCSSPMCLSMDSNSLMCYAIPSHVQAARPQPLYAQGKKGRRTTGFLRRHENLALYIILNAGHMIPSDQPEAALDLLQRILDTPQFQSQISLS